MPAVRPKTENLVPLVCLVRGEKVLPDADLAKLYGAGTEVLNQAGKRNRERFPQDFMFQLSRDKTDAMLRSRSQTVTLKRGENIKYLPCAFTEHGVAMLSSVLRSTRLAADERAAPRRRQPYICMATSPYSC